MIRHPWNRDFTWQERPGPFSALNADQVRHYDQHGYLVVPDLLPAAVLNQVVAEIDSFDAATEQGLRELDGERLGIAEAGALTFSVHLVQQSETLRRLVLRPELALIARDLIGPDVRLYWDQAVYKKPEKPRRFPWHQDNGYAYVEPQQYLTIWLALTDATEENGCPQVVPGVHHQGTLVHRYVDPLGWECLQDPEGVVPAPVKAGGAVVFSSLTPHLTGPNLTDSVRKAYIVQYAPDGAELLQGDPFSGPPAARLPCTDPARQYPVVVNGDLTQQTSQVDSNTS